LLVFVDSSALKANYDLGDDYHGEAAELMRKIAARETDISSFVTTDYVSRRSCYSDALCSQS
jgi:predicted nucleic acid-binding protein